MGRSETDRLHGRTDPVKGVLSSYGKLIARSSASQPAARAWPCRDGGDAALAPRPPPMVGDIPPCPRVVSRATLPGPVAASRWLYPPPSLLACLATTSLCHFLVLHRNLATALANVPIFRFSHALALIASYWGPDFVWVIALYCGYTLRKLLEKSRY